MLIIPVKDIFEVGTALNADVESQVLQLQDIYGYAIQVAINGSPDGSIKLQASCDPVPPQSLQFSSNGIPQYVPTNWSDIPDSEQSVSEAGTFFWNMPGCESYTFVKVAYRDGSSGMSDATITSSVFSGKGQ